MAVVAGKKSEGVANVFICAKIKVVKLFIGAQARVVNGAIEQDHLEDDTSI